MVNVTKVVLVFALVAASVVGTSLPAQALSLDELRARIAERRAEREQRLADLVSDTNENAPADNGVTECECSARLSLARPDLQFSGSGLIFTPRFDVSIRVRNEEAAPDWHLALDYDGSATFSSQDVPVPQNMSFSGHDEWSGACVDTRFSFRGHQPPASAVTLATIARSLVGDNQELDGWLNLNAALTGCDNDEENRRFPFTVEELGNLSVRSWRSVR